jgi:hypothetical protein
MTAFEPAERAIRAHMIVMDVRRGGGGFDR